MAVKYLPGIKMNRYSVYQLINPFNESPFYVGYTGDPNDRFRSHWNKEPKSKEGKLRWKLITQIRNCNKTLELQVIETFTYRSQAMKYESKKLKQLSN